MHPDLAKLVDLQAHDVEVKRLLDQMATLAKEVAALETKAKATVGQRKVIVDLIAQEDALRRKEESEIADLRQKLERAKKMHMTTTTAQLTALEHETAFARSEISRIEDAELESMERGEALDAQLVQADAAVAEAAATLEREKARAMELVAADRVALAQAEQERVALRAEIVVQSETGEGSLAAYDRIAKSKGTAVAEALHQQCTACHVMVRPQRWNDLRDNSAGSTA